MSEFITFLLISNKGYKIDENKNQTSCLPSVSIAANIAAATMSLVLIESGVALTLGTGVDVAAKIVCDVERAGVGSCGGEST